VQVSRESHVQRSPSPRRNTAHPFAEAQPHKVSAALLAVEVAACCNYLLFAALRSVELTEHDGDV
jgi:hypothetical protein